MLWKSTAETLRVISKLSTNCTMGINKSNGEGMGCPKNVIDEQSQNAFLGHSKQATGVVLNRILRIVLITVKDRTKIIRDKKILPIKLSTRFM
jgi:hypothetical protein